MWQGHNAQLANFDVTSLRVTASAGTQEADMAVYFRSRWAAEFRGQKTIAMTLASNQFLVHCRLVRPTAL
jgi:hypothetical protein